MKIAHVVTYISVDGAFGGPVAVALAQTEELARRGHEVDLLAGWDGQATLPASDVTHRLFPVRRIGPGFGGLIAPGLIAWLRTHGRNYDAVHVHLARDLITMSAARLALRQGRRLIVQPHGMITPDPRVRSRAMDSLTTRHVLRAASGVLALTDRECAGLPEVARADLPFVRQIANGVPAPDDVVPPTREDPPVVMFLARLHPRKRVLTFAEAARMLIERGSPARFEIFGPDEGDLAALQEFLRTHGLTERVAYRGSVAQGAAPEQLRRASVYVLPAVREVFPMTVLEALSVGTPTVIGSDCGIAPELARRSAAAVTDGSAAEVADAVEGLLIPGQRRTEQVERGLESVRDWFSIDAVTNALEEVYGGARELHHGTH